MASKTEEKLNMKVFPKWQIVIPAPLRKKYNIEIGDHLEVIPVHDGIFLKPSQKTKKQESLTDQLFGVFRDYVEKKPDLDKKEIEKAVEDGFIDGWDK